jgi:hypothetical protein
VRRRRTGSAGSGKPYPADLAMFDDTRPLATLIFACLDDVMTGRVDPVTAVRPLVAAGA